MYYYYYYYYYCCCFSSDTVIIESPWYFQLGYSPEDRIFQSRHHERHRSHKSETVNSQTLLRRNVTR